jgi:tetratricopeptide (TPR) repeat protein
VAVLFLIAALSAVAGYYSGIERRKGAEEALFSSAAAEQYDLALQDFQRGEFQLARQRLEYVAQLDPNYPGLVDQLALVLARINATATPTLAPTPTVAATADLRDVEGLFSQAQQAMFNSQWGQAIETLLSLRKTDPAYRAVEVDGMLFLAFRNRGLDKILNQADLEGGLYDLAVAERFGPMDSEASNMMNWASLYITGASFWELDWAKVLEYFSQVGPAMPGLRDRSGMSARERFRLALKGYGNTLLQSGDPCAAADQFTLSLQVGPDPEVDELLFKATTECQLGQAPTEAPSEGPAPTATLGGPLPTIEVPPATTPYPPPPAP